MFYGNAEAPINPPEDNTPEPQYTEESPVALDLVREIETRLNTIRENLSWRMMHTNDRQFFMETQLLVKDIISEHEPQEIEEEEDPEPPVDEDKMKAMQHRDR